MHIVSRKLKRTLAALAGLIALPTLAFPTMALAAPSYSCDGRLTINERLICDREGLGNLDREIADKFFGLTSRLNRAAADLVRQDQRLFIKERQACEDSVRCTRQVMMQRFNELDNQLAEQLEVRGESGDKVNEELLDNDRCGPGFTEANGECIHNSELEGENENDNNNGSLSLTPGTYGIYVLANGASLVMDPGADMLLFTHLKSGNPEQDRLQPFTVAFHQGAYVITDQKSGLRLHADGNGDKQLSTRYQPNDNFTKFLITPANEGCFFLRTLATGNHWTWRADTQVVITTKSPAGEASMFCFKRQ